MAPLTVRPPAPVKEEEEERFCVPPLKSKDVLVAVWNRPLLVAVPPPRKRMVPVLGARETVPELLRSKYPGVP